MRSISNVYIAASTQLSQRERAQHWVNHLALAGVRVVSTWLTVVDVVGSANPRDASPEERLQWTANCLREVRECDLLWFLVPPADVLTRGAWAEVGDAVATDKLLVSSGDTKQSIFCALGEERPEDLEAF